VSVIVSRRFPSSWAPADRTKIRFDPGTRGSAVSQSYAELTGGRFFQRVCDGS
jgi:hypothetical protein